MYIMTCTCVYLIYLLLLNDVDFVPETFDVHRTNEVWDRVFAEYKNVKNVSTIL